MLLSSFFVFFSLFIIIIILWRTQTVLNLTASHFSSAFSSPSYVHNSSASTGWARKMPWALLVNTLYNCQARCKHSSKTVCTVCLPTFPHWGWACSFLQDSKSLTFNREILLYLIISISISFQCGSVVFCNIVSFVLLSFQPQISFNTMNIRVSYHDMMMFLAIINSLPAQALRAKSQTSASNHLPSSTIPSSKAIAVLDEATPVATAFATSEKGGSSIKGD